MSLTDETKALCPLCDGAGLLLEVSPTSHRGLVCWLCKSERTITLETLARWKREGSPRSKPPGWDVIV